MKQQLREHIRNGRAAYSAQQRSAWSERICKRLMHLEEYECAHTIMLFMPLAHEVDITQVVRDALTEKRVLMPYVQDGRLFAAQITSLDDVQRGTFGIREPKRKVPFEGKIDLVIVPGVAFDPLRGRLGHGMGYYDKFLGAIRAPKIGVAFASQLVERIPQEPHDVAMNLVITEEGIQ